MQNALWTKTDTRAVCIQMPKAQTTLAVDAFQKNLRPFMKRIGFRVRGRTFNRTTEDGLTQVVNLQKGPDDPPGFTVSGSLHGRFAVNLGVYVPEVARFRSSGEAGGFVQEYYCCIRARLGRLGPEKKDLWWIASSEPSLAEEIEWRLEKFGVPFLDLYRSRTAILEMCLDDEESISLTTKQKQTIAAIILAVRGEKQRAQALLTQHAQEEQKFLNHHLVEQVVSLAARLELDPIKI